MRSKNRKENQIRPIKIIRNYTKYSDGSVFIQLGNTKILCNATAKEGVPRFLKGSLNGWITAEYNMLPGSTNIRNIRDIVKGKKNERSVEIQRFIGRALRASVDLSKLKNYTIIVDCDVIQADGSTRSASVTGSCIALIDCFKKLILEKKIDENPIKFLIAGISVGIINKKFFFDLEYEEDLTTEIDMNIVITEDKKIIEIQSFSEKNELSIDKIFDLIKFGLKNSKNLFLKLKKYRF